MVSRVVFSLVLASPCLAFPQWEDVQRLGNGGETYVSTDGKGTVYASSHIPVQVLVSRDWGKSWGKAFPFPDSLGDTVVLARPGGKAVVSYMLAPLDPGGMSTWTTEDYGQTWKRGEGIKNRKLDREWMAVNEATGAAYMIYSDGYIGGPKSRGVFVSKSDDGGMTWSEVSRVDREGAGDYAVDPHLVASSDGKLYAFWTVSSDYDTVDSYKCAVSTDGGKTWGRHMTLANLTKKIGDQNVDTQERWMLGGLAANGEKDVVAFYMDWTPVTIGGQKKPALVVHARFSNDAGMTWGKDQTILNSGELSRAAKLYYDKKIADENNPFYMQCLSWACYDPSGKPHFIWQDNRDGQAKLNDHYYNQWHVRHAWAGSSTAERANSERVSRSVVCIRPPLDFMCCTADEKYLYVTWTEAPKAVGGWEFSGEFWFGRKPLDSGQ